jgi:transcriptional regulator with XRE-family HTH domain
MDLCAEIASGRREKGLSQQALAEKCSVDRGAIARLEAGSGSVGLLVRVMAILHVRFKNIARGENIVEQLGNARALHKWSVLTLAQNSGLDPRTVASLEAGRGSVASLTALLKVLAPDATRQEVSGSHWSYHKLKDAERDLRFTPPHIIAALVDAFGPIGLDPCGHADAPLLAARKIMLPEDGLAADWSADGLLYINPPFSNLSPWLSKALDAFEAGSVTKLIFMLPTSRFDLRDFADRASNYATTLILKRRFTFVSPNPRYSHPVPFSIGLICAGSSRAEIERFRDLIPSMVMQPQARSYDDLPLVERVGSKS